MRIFLFTTTLVLFSASVERGVASAQSPAVPNPPQGEPATSPSAGNRSAGSPSASSPATAPSPPDQGSVTAPPQQEPVQAEPAQPPTQAPTQIAAPAPVDQSEQADQSTDQDKKEKKHKKKKKGKHKKDNAEQDNAEQDKAAKEDVASDANDDDADAKKQTFRVKGRLFVISDLTRQRTLVVNGLGVPEEKRNTSLDLAVQSARVGLVYRSPMKWLLLNLQLELAGKPSMKDAYAQAGEKSWQVRAGQFKMPISAIEMESSWALPTAHRGFIHNLLVNRLDVAGRRPGVTASLQGPGALKPRITLGAFQGSQLTALTGESRNTSLISKQGMDSQSLIGRAQIKIETLKLGVSYEHRVGAPTFLKTRHFWTLGGDAQWAFNHSSGGLRVWGDFLHGASWYEDPSKINDGKDAVFITVRAIVAYRFGGVKQGDLYIEPFVFGGVHDPDAKVTEDQALEGMLGVGAGFWDRARLTLQGEVVKVGRNFPASYAVGSDPDQQIISLQAGVSF